VQRLERRREQLQRAGGLLPREVAEERPRLEAAAQMTALTVPSHHKVRPLMSQVSSQP
jgi:hypothetical protein